MIVAGAPSTLRGVIVSRRCACRTGSSHTRTTPEVPRNAERAQSEGPRQGGVPKSAAEDSIKVAVAILALPTLPRNASEARA